MFKINDQIIEVATITKSYLPTTSEQSINICPKNISFEEVITLVQTKNFYLQSENTVDNDLDGFELQEAQEFITQGVSNIVLSFKKKV